MSLFRQTRINFAAPKVPNGAEPIRVPLVQLCFTCVNIKALQGCTSVVLECQGLASNIETKSSILQVICQLLRVQGRSLESLILEDENLPFCPCCLKVISEIIILREKLFQIETEIREKLRTLEASVAESFETYGDDVKKKTPEEGSIEYDDLRVMFQTQVMEEHTNKELLRQKILQLNQNPNTFAAESMPSMVQFQLEKNVFSIAGRKPSLKVEAIDCDFQIRHADASTDTKDLKIPEERTRIPGRADLRLYDAEMLPVLASRASDAADLVPVNQGFSAQLKNQNPEITCIPSPEKKTKAVPQKFVKSQFRYLPQPSKLIKRPSLPNPNPVPCTAKRQEPINPLTFINLPPLTAINIPPLTVINLPPLLTKFNDAKTPPVIDLAGSEVDEDFSLVPVDQGLNISDDSDYGSPSKKSKPENVMITNTVLKKNPQPRTVIPRVKKVLTRLEPNDLAKSRLRNYIAPKPLKLIKRPLFSNPKPTTSKQQETVDSEEELEEDDGDGSDWILKDGDSDSSDSTSSEEPNGDDGVKDGGAELEDSAEVSSVSISEICKTQDFKTMAKPTSKDDPNEPTFVKVIQKEATFKARDNTLWTSQEPNHIRQTRAYEVLRQKGGLVGPATDSTMTPTELFKLMFPPTILETIVKHTNAHAIRTQNNPKPHSAGLTELNPLTVTEMYAYIGILLFLGTERKSFSYSSLKEVWAKDERYAIPIVSATMNRNRFSSIQSYIKFHDDAAPMTVTNKNETKEAEEANFCYISEVFEPFVENMQNHLCPYETLVVDEMLVKFQGKSKFRVNMKAKHGLRLWVLCDAETGYILKIALDERNASTQARKDLGKKVVLDLVKKYFGSGRGVTIHNLYVSKLLGEELMKNRMSMLGTLKHKQIDVIRKFVDLHERELQSSVFAFQRDFTMVSYVPKRNRTNKLILLLSTQHHSSEISSEDGYKPKMVLDYNTTTQTANIADRTIRAHTCQRTTLRWSVKLFQALLDIAALNAYTIYKMHCNSTAVTPTSRKTFLRSLSEGLMEPTLTVRFEKGPSHTAFPHLCKLLEKLEYVYEEEDTLETRVQNFLSGEILEKPKRLNGQIRGFRCTFCPKRRMIATIRCKSCRKYVCRACLIRICPTPECSYVMTTALARENPQASFNLKMK